MAYLRSLILAVIAHGLLWACFHYLLSSSKPSPSPPLRVKIITATPHANEKKPKDNKALAKKDHSTDKQTAPRSNAQHIVTHPTSNAANKQNQQAPKKAAKRLPQAKTLIVNPKADKDISYEEFLQHSAQAMAGIAWQEEEGDVVDINTTSHRYTGYFIAMRNAISLAWHYPPRAATEGQQGLVKLDFSVDAEGYASAIRIIKSSGYHLLDEAIVSAIRSASPFQPLPTSIGKEKIRIRGSFWYVLND